MRPDLANRWVVLAVLFFVGLTAPIQFQSVAAVADYMIADAGLTYTGIGAMMGIFMLPGVVLAAPMGPLSAKIGDRMALVGGIALMALSALLFAATDNYAVMYGCRLAGGAGAVAVSVLLPKVVNDWFTGKEIATAMAIIASSVGFGIGLAMALLPVVASATSWRGAMLATSFVCLLGIGLLLAVYRDAAPRATGSSSSPLLWRISRHEFVLSSLAGIGRGLFSSGYSVVMSFIPPLLIARGQSAVDAGMMTSLAALVSLAAVPLGGYLSDRTGKPDYFIVGGSISTAVVCALMPYWTPIVIWVVLFGALRGGCTGGLMSLPSRVLKPESRSTGFAVVSATYFICMTVFPPIAGYLLDRTGKAASPLLFAAILWFSITILLLTFRFLERRWASRSPA